MCADDTAEMIWTAAVPEVGGPMSVVSILRVAAITNTASAGETQVADTADADASTLARNLQNMVERLGLNAKIRAEGRIVHT